MTEVVGVLHYPMGEDYGYHALAPRRPRRIYRRTLWWKSNPRDESYMRELFAERYPGGQLHEGPSPPPAELTVLLYPDSIGLGFAPVERELSGRSGLRALTGRRRDFALDKTMLRRLRARRALERTMLVEAIALPLFLALAVPMWLFDALRGRT